MRRLPARTCRVDLLGALAKCKDHGATVATDHGFIFSMTDVGLADSNARPADRSQNRAEERKWIGIQWLTCIGGISMTKRAVLECKGKGSTNLFRRNRKRERESGRNGDGGPRWMDARREPLTMHTGADEAKSATVALGARTWLSVDHIEGRRGPPELAAASSQLQPRLAVHRPARPAGPGENPGEPRPGCAHSSMSMIQQCVGGLALHS